MTYLSSSDLWDDGVSRPYLQEEKKAKPGLMSDVTRGFGQVIESSGSALKDVYEPLGGAVEEYGAGIVQRHPSEINSFQDVLDRPGTALREGFGEMGGQLPPALAGAYAGGKAGLALSSAIPHPGAKALAAGAGAFIGAFAPSWIQEYGEIRKGQRESGQEDRGIAGVGATGAALVETALGPESWMARSIGRKMGGKALSEFSEAGARDLLSSGFLKGAAKKGLQTGLIEGPLTEIPQTAMERWAQFKDVGGAEALDEYGVAGVKGFAGGAGIGTITAPMQRMRASSFVDQIDTAREAIQDPNMGQREKFEAAEFLQRVKANDEGDTVARDWHRAFQEAQLTDAYDQAVAEGDTIRRDVFAKQIEAIRFAREVEQKQSVDLLGAIEASTGLQAMQERLPMGIGQQVPSVVSVEGKEIPEVGVGGKVVGPDFGLTKAGQEYQQWWVDQQAIQDAQRTPGVMTDMFSGEMGFAPPVQRVEEPAPIAPVAGTKYVTAPPVTQGELFTPTGGVRKAAEEAKATSKAKAPPKAPTQKQQVQATVDALLASGEITQEQHKDWTNDLDQKKDPLKVRNEVNKFKEVKNAPKATETKVLKVPKETRTKVPVQTEGVKNGISSEVVPTGDKNLKKGSNLQTKENAVVPTAKTSEGSQTKAAKVVPSTPVPVDEIEDETHAEAVRMHLAGDALRPIADALGATAPTWNKILASYGYTAKGKQAADEAQAETGTSFSVDDPVANPASAAEVSENAGADLDTGDEVVKKGEGTVAALPGMKLRNVPNSGAPVLAVNDRTSVKEVKAAISAIPTPVRKRAEEQARDLGLSVATAPAQTQLVIYSAANEGRDVTAADVEQAKSLQVALTSASKGGETKLSAQEKAEAAAEKLAESKKVVDGLLEKLLGGDADAANDLVTLLNTDPNGSRLALTIRDAFSPPKQADTTLKLVGYLFNTAEQQRKERKVETASKFKTKAVSMGALIDGEWSVIPDEEIAQATNLLPNMGASVETILSEDEKAEVADHFQAEDSFGLATKKMFLKEYANWLHAGAKATHQLADIFRKVLKSVVSGVMAIAVAFNLSNTQVPEANATQLPVNKFTIERMYKSPKADFNGVDASADVKMVADWQVRKAGGKAFIIADKVGGLLYAFDTNGALVAKTPALYGADRGDVEIGADKAPDALVPGEKITPAGVFAGRKPSNAEYGNGMVTIKEGANGSIAIHRVYLGDPKEKRTARLDSATAEDNRISYGCINVPAKFADEILEKHFSGASEVVVMPDTATLEDTFPMMSAADPIVKTEVRLGGKTDSSTEAAWGSDKYGKPEDVSLSRGAKDTTGTTVRKIKNALAKWFFSPELLASKVTIVQKWSDLPVEVRQKVEGSKKSSGDASGLVQGFVLNGQAYLIADNIDVGTERSVFMHEVGAHIGLTEKEEAFFASEIKGWAKSPEGSLERKIYEAVKKRMASAKERSDREWVAYATEESVNAGVKPGVVGKAAKWMRELAIAVMNAVKLKMGIGRQLTAQDLVDYTYGAAGLALEGQRANAGAGVNLSVSGAVPPSGGAQSNKIVPFTEATVKNRLDSMLTTAKDLANKALHKVVFMHDLVDVAVREGLTTAKGFNELMGEKDQIRNRKEELVDQIMQRAANLKEADKTAAEAFLRTSTIEAKWGYDDNPQKMKADPVMKSKFNSLSKDAQKVVREIFQMGEDNYNEMKTLAEAEVNREYNELVKRAKDPAQVAELEKERAKEVNRLTKVLPKLQGPYAPLKRFGDHVVVAKSAEYEKAKADNNQKKLDELKKDPKHYLVEMYATAGEAEFYAKQYKKLYSNVVSATKQETFKHMDELPWSGIAKIKEAIRSDPEMAAKQSMQKLVTDLYLQMLAESSARKSRMGREGITGAGDMFRAFAAHGRSNAHFIASMSKSGEVSKQITKMKEQAHDNEDGKRDAKNRVYNEIAARFAQGLDYRETPMVDKMLRLSSIWMLLTSPSYYLTNATQTFMVAMPLLGGTYGGRAFTEITKAYKDVSRYVSKMGHELDINALPISQKEKEMLIHLRDTGKLDITIASDLGRWAEGTMNQGNLSKVLQKMSAATAKVEALNRITTALAAYRLSGGNATYAGKIVDQSQGNYAGNNAPRFFATNGATKLATQFRKYQLVQLSLIGRLLHTAFKGATPIERTAAKKAFLWMFAQQLVLTGVKGAPIPAAVLMLAAALGGDDDKDWERNLRKWAGDDDAAILLTRGLPAAMGLDVSGRIGMGNTFSILPFSDVELSKQGYKEAVFGLTGAFVGGMGSAMFDGMDKMSKGQYYKGVEAMMPRGLRDLMGGFRLATEGVTDSRGDTKLSPDEISFFAGAMKAVGLPTTSTTEFQNSRGDLIELSKHFKERDSALKNEYAAAMEDKDASEMNDLRKEWAEVQEAKKRWAAEMQRRGFKDPKLVEDLKVRPLSSLLKAGKEKAKREKPWASIEAR